MLRKIHLTFFQSKYDPWTLNLLMIINMVEIADMHAVLKTNQIKQQTIFHCTI